MFTVGGTEINIHKYLGPKPTSDENSTADQPQYNETDHTTIQDLLFLENRDRKYDQDVYNHRAIYNVQDIDFDLSQFGLFLSNDILFMTVHIRGIVKTLGRKPISGDVIELPHLKDEYSLEDVSVALKRFYVIEDVTRASEGFSPTWYPHLYRLKLKQIYDGQEFADILDLPADECSDDNTTLRDLLSTYEKEMQINNAIVAQAEADSLESGFETSHYYTVTKDAEDGTIELQTVDATNIDASAGSITVDEINTQPLRKGYSGYLMDYGDGDTPNGTPFGSGVQFPRDNYEGDFYLRTDFMPNRLFRYDGRRWVKIEDDLRMTLSNRDDRKTHRTSFTNNTTVNTINGEAVPERQALSSALRPKADNE
jgi:hypothetical protein